MSFGVTARAASGAAVRPASNVITSFLERRVGSIYRPIAECFAWDATTPSTGAEDGSGWPTARRGMAQLSMGERSDGWCWRYDEHGDRLFRARAGEPAIS